MRTNSEANTKALNHYRKHLKAMVGDIGEVDKRVLNRALNEGLAVVSRHTPTKTGTLRRSWKVHSAKKIGKSVRGSLSNNVVYAPFVNYGHRVVNRSGETVGFVKGKFMLEKAVTQIEDVMTREFRKEIDRVNKRYDS